MSDDGHSRRRARTRVGQVLFGDRIGLALFLGTLCFGILFWRAGTFITDNVTLVRTLEALSEGRVAIEPATGDHFDAPGTGVRDGQVYGRNYGQLVASLPALYVLQAVDAVADLRVALTAAFHLLLLWMAIVVGDLRDRRRLATLVAAPVVLLLFGLNLAVATTLPELSDEIALVALQLTTVVATAGVAVVMYRLLALDVSRGVATLAGVASVAVLPVGFWAAIPKRHVFTVLACLVVLFLFAASRRDSRHTVPGLGPLPLARAGAYATAGLLTWVHAGEGLFLFLVLVAVDLPTAPRNDLRDLAVVGAVFALSMLPTVATNLAVTGELYSPPRSLGGGITEPAAGTGNGDTGTDGSGLLDTLADLLPLGVVGWVLGNVGGVVRDGLLALGDPERLYHTFVRSAGGDLAGGRPEFIGTPAFAGTNLSVLESAPVLSAGVVVAVGWLVRGLSTPQRLRSHVDATMVLAGGLLGAFVLLYLSRLPLYVQITQRYLLPVFPLGLYLLARSGVVTRLVTRERAALSWSYAGGVLVGGQLLLVAVLVRDLPPGEAAQLYASTALVLATVLGVATAVTLTSRRIDRPAAIALGLACAAGTVFVAIAHLQFFSATGDAILPVVQELTAVL